LPAPSPDAYAHDTPAQLAATRPVFAKGLSWTACRTDWIRRYSVSIAGLGKAVAAPGQQPLAAISAVKDGEAIVAAYQAAMRENAAEQAQWQAHIRAMQQAVLLPRPAAP
ncbi:MAG TPA: hypothetical protein VGB91_11790, partial [Rhizomicrobium sp.]